MKEDSYGRKISDLLAFLFPFLLLVLLAIAGGGYDLLARHVAGILSWIIVATLLPGRWPDPIRPGKSLALIGGLILSLAALSAISSIWSISVSASMAEFERVIGYLGFFTAGYLVLRTPKQREWFARGVVAGIAVLVFLALGERLIAGNVQSSETFFLGRLDYPLGYWNADGIVFGAGAVLFLWFAAIGTDRRWRSVSTAMTVMTVVAMYLTYSRNGLLVAIIGLTAVFFFSPRRLRILGVATIAVAASVPVLMTISRYPTISGGSYGTASAGEALVVILVAAVCLAFGALAVDALSRAAARRPEVFEPAVRISKDRRLLIGLAGAAVAALLFLTLAFGQHVWEGFSDSDVPASSDPSSRFTELSGSWRYEFDQVALDTFADHPLLGSGAGTYRFEWTVRRDIPVVTTDAHNFYLQNLAELGLPGGLISFGLAFALIWLGVVAWRRGLGRDGPVMLAVTIALLFSFGFDWFWRLGDTAALLMLFAAWIASAEAVDPARRRSVAGTGFRLTTAIGCWFAVVVLAVPAIADRYIEASADSVRSGHLEKAIDQANTALKFEPWNPEPHLQLGTIAEGRGQTELAVAEFDRASELEPENWWAVLLRLRVNYNAGRIAEARRDYERLKEINPVYFAQFSFGEVRELVS